MANTFGRRNIFEAAAKDDLEDLKDMVETQNALPIQKNDDEQTAAHIAAERGNLNILKYLLDKEKALAATKDINGNTVLDIAAENGRLAIVKYLLEKIQVDVHRTNNLRLGNTVLHTAALAGQLEVLKYILEKNNLDPNMRNHVEQPPAFLAASNKHLDVIKYLTEECKANMTLTDYNENNILYMSAPSGDLAVPKYLLDEKKIDLDVNWRDILGETVLQRAARYGQLEFMKYFVEQKNVDLNLRDFHGRSALHEAATKGYLPVVEYLVENGANPEIKDLYNKTPLKVTLDPQIIDYLNGTRRTRRSLSEILDMPSSNSLILPPTLTSNRIQGNPLAGIGINSVNLNVFLVLARMSVRRFEKNRPANSSLPIEMRFKKIDRIALGVIDSSSAFE